MSIAEKQTHYPCMYVIRIVHRSRFVEMRKFKLEILTDSRTESVTDLVFKAYNFFMLVHMLVCICVF